MVDDPQRDDPVFQYLTGQEGTRAQAALLAAFDEESAEAVRALRPDRDLSYGKDPRQRFDLFRARAARATIAYFHAGYWQSRDKAQFRFLAPALVAQVSTWRWSIIRFAPRRHVEALTERRANHAGDPRFQADRGKGGCR